MNTPHSRSPSKKPPSGVLSGPIGIATPSHRVSVIGAKDVPAASVSYVTPRHCSSGIEDVAVKPGQSSDGRFSTPIESSLVWIGQTSMRCHESPKRIGTLPSAARYVQPRSVPKTLASGAGVKVAASGSRAGTMAQRRVLSSDSVSAATPPFGASLHATRSSAARVAAGTER